ncbi:RHS repeat-associated core domain-containing protein, partial [Flavobacterium sp. MAH-1]
QVNGGTNERIFLNAYDDLGQLVEKQVGQIGTGALQHVDYKYNIRGWLTDINDVDPGHASGDLFSFRINYDTVGDDLDDEVSPLYNGNISETFWRSSSDGFQRKYGYKYDGLNRLLHAYYQRPYENVPRSRSYDEWMAYDRNGNITSLGRNGDYEDLTAVQPIDDLVYTYEPHTNKLVDVDDLEAHASGFNDGNTGDDYGYDTYGNMTADKNKDIGTITYNHLNLPLKILYFDGSFITYQYNASGTKVRKLVSKQVGSNQEQTTTVYQQGFQYENNTLQFIAHPEGYIKATKVGNAYQFNYVYQYKDHLGNIRMNYALDPSDNEVKILNEDHYYPFGLKHTNYNSDVKNFQEDPGFSTLRIIQVSSEGNTYRYKYNGKEWQDELGLNFYDYGARNYDPAIGRWMNIDPLAETSRRWSPYDYAYNNPIVFVDPDGMQAKWIPGVDGKAITYTTDKNGNLTVSQNATEDTKTIVAGINESKSEKAKSQFKGIADSEGKVNLVIDKENTGANGSKLYGLHQPHDASGKALNWNKDTQSFDGTPETIVDSKGNTIYKEATITIFDKNFDDLSNNKFAVLGKTGIWDSGLTKSDAMTGTVSHEIDHNLNPYSIEAIIDRANGRTNNYEVEPPAYQVQKKVHEEIKAARQ